MWIIGREVKCVCGYYCSVGCCCEGWEWPFGLVGYLGCRKWPKEGGNVKNRLNSTRIVYIGFEWDEGMDESGGGMRKGLIMIVIVVEDATTKGMMVYK